MENQSFENGKWVEATPYKKSTRWVVFKEDIEYLWLSFKAVLRGVRYDD